MKKFIPILENSPLFAGIAEKNIESLLPCLLAEVECFEKGELVFYYGDKPKSIGLVLSGCVHIVEEDFWGNRNILSEVCSGDLFAEAFVCAGIDRLPVSAVVVQDAEIMLIDYQRIITSCSSACVFHTDLIKNMLRIIARKNTMLVNKIKHLTKRGTREKLLSYLSEQAKYARSNVFYIPFNRQELADYLSVERSALSAEMSKMRSDGLIVYRKNHFKLL